MKIPFMPRLPRLPSKEEFQQSLIRNMLVIITTDNPNNLDIKSDMEENLQGSFLGIKPCYKVEVEKEENNPTYVIKLYLQVPFQMQAFTTQFAKMFYDILYNDKSLKRNYPDRRISWQYLEGEKDAEKK